jgi:hypothetical protein
MQTTNFHQIVLAKFSRLASHRDLMGRASQYDAVTG